MKHHLIQIVALVTLVVKFTSSQDQCFPENFTHPDFPPQELAGVYKIIYCIDCLDLRCAVYTIWNIPYKDNEYNEYFSAYNESSGEVIEETAIDTKKGPGEYLYCPLDGSQCTTYYFLALRENFNIEVSCVPDENGNTKLRTTINARNKDSLGESDLAEIQPILKKNGMKIEDFSMPDNKYCPNMDKNRS